MKYTKGPWIAYNNGYGIIICPETVVNDLIPNVSAQHNKICKLSVPEPWDDEQWEKIKANALIISLCPDLIDSLENLVTELEAHEIHAPARIKQAKDLIKKARGE